MNHDSFFSTTKKLGILGGGQLGKMLLYKAQQWDIYTKIIDPDPNAPCRNSCSEFVCGSLTDFDTVYHFGQDCDTITIEIEHVNVDALRKLQSEGKTIHPNPDALATIQNKGNQKIFYSHHHIPTSDFIILQSRQHVLESLERGIISVPFVQKSLHAGYDGKGVCVVKSTTDIDKLMDTPCLVEGYIEIKTEIAVIVARNQAGEVAVYDPVSMDFHEEANLLDLLLYPAPIMTSLADEAKQYAKQIIEALNICGVLAVEFLIDPHDKLYVNECAPRPHNSGHQTIESTITSQYEQHLRAILNLPLGATDILIPSAMINLLGHPDYQGQVIYQGIEQCLQTPNVHIHLYGKHITKPYRKMGHITVTNQSLEKAKQTAEWARQQLKVISH